MSQRNIEGSQRKETFHVLIRDLRLFDHCFFFFFRKMPQTYKRLLSLVGQSLEKQQTNRCKLKIMKKV